MEVVVFTPLAAIVGGVLIGIASSLLLLASGRIAGISGILGSALRPLCPDRVWRLLFLIGLPLGALAASAILGRGPAPRMAASAPVLVLAGLLVGFGTQLGSGCTSGHGVCGLARRSKRSLVATLTFMLTGAVTVFVVRHLLGSASS
ncbi:MAG TPA: YeeE/YedE family protein [Myxococcota bacterium]|jgi:hypothetical protein